MARLAVIGNISLDHIVCQDGECWSALGGAGLHVALAATRAGLRAAPVSVIGDDLDLLRRDPRLRGLDLSAVATATGSSATFILTYTADGALSEVQATYGAATQLTDHARSRVRACTDDAYHVCCRTPLDIGSVLHTLTRYAAPFSVDFIVSSARESIAAATAALPHARIVFVNAAEYELLNAAVAISELVAIVVTDGPRPVCLLRHGRLVAKATPPSITPRNLTGAGDTLTGAFLAAHAAGLPDAVALRHAVTAASDHTIRSVLRLHTG